MFPWKEPRERIPLAVRQNVPSPGRSGLLLLRRLIANPVSVFETLEFGTVTKLRSQKLELLTVPDFPVPDFRRKGNFGDSEPIKPLRSEGIRGQ